MNKAATLAARSGQAASLITPHAAGVRLVVVEDFNLLIPLRRRWNDLASRSFTNSIFQTFELHEAWWQAFGDRLRLNVLLAYVGDDLVGIAPLASSERRILGLRRSVVQFIGTRSFDYADLIVDQTHPEVFSVLLEELVTYGRPLDLLYLRDVPDSSPTIDAARRLFGSRLMSMDVSVLYNAPARIFNDPENDRRLPLKKSLRRHYNALARSGNLECTARLPEAEVRRLLDTFFEQHVRRRAATDTPSVFIDERARVFFRELVDTLAPCGWLLFSVVTLDSRPIAMHFGFEYGGRITWYKPSFDMDFAKQSPGEVLMKCLLEYALDRHVAELDFTIGDEEFKYRFSNHVRSNCAVRVYRHRAEYAVHKVLLYVRAFVEHHPALSRAARRLTTKWRDQPWF